jgi:hypothetical protein
VGFENQENYSKKLFDSRISVEEEKAISLGRYQ